MAPLVVAVAGLVVGAGSAYMQYKSGKDAQDVAERNAALNRQESADAAAEALKMSEAAAETEKANTAERIRLTTKEQDYQSSLAKARAAASGAGAGGTTDIYLSALEQAGQEELDWIELVGEAEYTKQLDQGRVSAANAMAGAWNQPYAGGNSAWLGTVGSTIGSTDWSVFG